MTEGRHPELSWHGTASAARPTGFSTGWRSLAYLLMESADGPGWHVECRDQPAWTTAACEGFVILPQSEHRLTMTGPACRSTWTALDCSWSDGSDPLAGQHGAVRVPAPAMARVRRHLQALSGLDQDHGWVAGLGRQRLRTMIMLALDLPWSRSQVPDPRIRSAMQLVDDQPDRRFTCGELAAAAGLGLAQFHAVFRHDLGLTPLAWMARRRIRLAQQLLSSSALPVAAIAERCGFACPFHFSRVFRRLTRQSPRAFRRGAAAG